LYKIDCNQAERPYDLKELVRMFLPPSEYQVLEEGTEWEVLPEDTLIRLPDGIIEKDDCKRWLWQELSRHTGKTPEWGILTGVRPVKLFGELVHRTGSPEGAAETLKERYYLDPEKIRLLAETWQVQQETMGEGDPRKVAVYIGIPFCPTRCLYCSFTSNQGKPEAIARYLEALKKEIAFAGAETRRCGLIVESVYMGGGTPTTLTAEQLADLLAHTRASFDLSQCREFTVESGRPDTITEEKLQAILDSGAERISINPQTMKQETLDRIGRNHTPEEIRQAFQMAKNVAMPVVNADLIAGLPGEEPEDFVNSLQEMLDLRPANITVHTLAVKRASRLIEQEKDYNYHQGNKVKRMLEAGSRMLAEAGYRPYYLYRQKQMTGNFENVGYALPGTENLYNMKIMEENQTIIALGAGGISKVWYPAENRLERVPNVSNYEIYIERLEEMMDRKRKGIFADAAGTAPAATTEAKAANAAEEES